MSVFFQNVKNGDIVSKIESLGAKEVLNFEKTIPFCNY